MNISYKIEDLAGLEYVGGCSDDDIMEAEERLGLSFPDEFIEYVKLFGCISFGHTEWTGLNIEGELNVVKATLDERKRNIMLPSKLFVLEDYHINGKKIVVNESGECFLSQNGTLSKVCESIGDYLDICIRNDREADKAAKEKADETPVKGKEPVKVTPVDEEGCPFCSGGLLKELDGDPRKTVKQQLKAVWHCNDGLGTGIRCGGNKRTSIEVTQYNKSLNLHEPAVIYYPRYCPECGRELTENKRFRDKYDFD